jgi:Ankyrin repeats (3 copies)
MHGRRRRAKLLNPREPLRWRAVVIAAGLGCLWSVGAVAQPAAPSDSTRRTILVGADLRGYEWPAPPPLVAAAAAGDVAKVKDLLAAGEEVNPRGGSRGQDQEPVAPQGWPEAHPHSPRLSPVVAAAQGGHVAVLSVLVEAGADLVQDGPAALQAAVEDGAADVVRFLLAYDVAVPDSELPALARAAVRPDLPRLHALLAQGILVDTPDAKGRTPLMWAASAGEPEAVALLLRAEADPNRQDGRYTSCNVPQYACGVDGGRRSPLIWAARAGQAEVVRQLLGAGADPNQPDAFGETPLHWAAYHGAVEVVEVLVAGGARVDDGGSLYHRTPLFLAARAGQTEVVRRLLEVGVVLDK